MVFKNENCDSRYLPPRLPSHPPASRGIDFGAVFRSSRLLKRPSSSWASEPALTGFDK
jgi:hypothetical protein